MASFWASTDNDANGRVTTSEKPDWLAKDDAENPSSKDWESTEKGTSSITGDPLAPPPENDDDKPSSSSPGRFNSIFLFLMSAALLGLFIYSVTTQKNDEDRIEWSMFYGISAVIPALFLCHWLLWFPDKLIYLVSTGMAVWAIVYIVLYSLDLKDITSSGGDEEARKELIMELAGISLGLFSALYHPCVMRCCIKK
jgi:hypothetical protein